MEEINGGLGNVPGYTFSAVECGIKYSDRLDFCLISSAKPCHAAGMFTQNRVTAAPVALCKERIHNPVYGILVNATNANACTGNPGYENARVLTGEAARLLNIPEDSLLMASTGVIGVQLPVEKMKQAIPDLTDNLSSENGSLISQAIMTTDTFPKEYAAVFSSPAGSFYIAGTAKGAGMIAPDMATLLAFVLTDMPLEKKTLEAVFKRCVNTSFNAITIDGDTSTNDTALLLCPQAESPVTNKASVERFEEVLGTVLLKLAEMIVRDAEGATKFVRVNISGAASQEDARLAAKSISESLLVKTALFGRDPNWGRIACAAGYSGAELNSLNLSISINGILLLDKGTPKSMDVESIATAMARQDISIDVDLGAGSRRFTYYTSDISYDYVKINAEYTT